MTLKEIFDIEQGNSELVYLYSEGLFWKAYEKSAFRMVRYVGKFKETKRFIKYLGTDIISIGFPKAGEEKFLAAATIEKREETGMIVRIGEPFEEREFQDWKNSVTLAAPRKGKKEKEGTPDYSNVNATAHVNHPTVISFMVTNGTPANDTMDPVGEIVYKLRNFQIENHTPMECMMCLAELRKLVAAIQ